jgi:hypothetical protein
VFAFFRHTIPFPGRADREDSSLLPISLFISILSLRSWIEVTGHRRDNRAEEGSGDFLLRSFDQVSDPWSQYQVSYIRKYIARCANKTE